MPNIEKNELLEFEILKHVEETPTLNNRLAAAKLGCSVKLAHALLKKMVSRGFLHIKKYHSRRWDYFLTPKGITEKARLTYEFLEFSMQFYHEARKRSSQLCRDLAESKKTKVALLGAGELAEIVYLGAKQWGLDLVEIFDDEVKDHFLGHKVRPCAEIETSAVDAIIVSIYKKENPMSENYLPETIKNDKRMVWVFGTPTTERTAEVIKT